VAATVEILVLVAMKALVTVPVAGLVALGLVTGMITITSQAQVTAIVMAVTSRAKVAMVT
jgi:hypothetical protein